MSAKSSSTKPRNSEVTGDIAASYNEFKEYEGRKYTGMRIGRSHKWYYDQGEWREKKVTPDLRQITYAVTKRRAGRAPEGSGVPGGTEYHWYIAPEREEAERHDYTQASSRKTPLQVTTGSRSIRKALDRPTPEAATCAVRRGT